MEKNCDLDPSVYVWVKFETINMGPKWWICNLDNSKAPFVVNNFSLPFTNKFATAHRSWIMMIMIVNLIPSSVRTFEGQSINTFVNNVKVRSSPQTMMKPQLNFFFFPKEEVSNYCVFSLLRKQILFLFGQQLDKHNNFIFHNLHMRHSIDIWSKVFSNKAARELDFYFFKKIARSNEHLKLDILMKDEWSALVLSTVGGLLVGLPLICFYFWV